MNGAIWLISSAVRDLPAGTGQHGVQRLAHLGDESIERRRPARSSTSGP